MVEGDQDEFKRVLTEGNPLLLGLTFVVSLLHSVFDMLAFKNDIGFWKNKKSMEGLSIKSIFINAFCQVSHLLRRGGHSIRACLGLCLLACAALPNLLVTSCLYSTHTSNIANCARSRCSFT